MCPWFEKGTSNWGNKCHFIHEKGDSLVMMVEQQVQAAMEGMKVQKPQGTGQGVDMGMLGDDPKQSCLTLEDPRIPLPTLPHNTHMVMHARARGQRSAFRQQKPKTVAQRVRQLVQEAVNRAAIGQGALTGVAGSKVTKTQVTRVPTYDQHMAKRQALADAPNDGAAKMTKGRVD